MAEKCQHGSPSERLTKRPFTLSRRRMQKIASEFEGPFDKNDWNEALERDGFYLDGRVAAALLLGVNNVKRLGVKEPEKKGERGLTLYTYVRHAGY